jgi:hypothetical protein
MASAVATRTFYNLRFNHKIITVVQDDSYFSFRSSMHKLREFLLYAQKNTCADTFFSPPHPSLLLFIITISFFFSPSWLRLNRGLHHNLWSCPRSTQLSAR